MRNDKIPEGRGV